MKKFLCAAAVAVVGICSAISFVGCKAGNAEVNFTLSEDGTYYIVSGVSGDKRALRQFDVPAEYESLPVKEIGEEAFYHCETLSDISLPDTIEKISARAFAYSGISSVGIPDSVTTIGFAAFAACESLTEVTVPSNVTVLESRAFAYCTKLERAFVKAEITVLEERVFYNSVVSYGGSSYSNTSLKEVYLPATLKKIRTDALAGNAVTDIYFAGSEAEWNQLYFFDLVEDEKNPGEFKENRVEKNAVLRDSVKIHYSAEF